MKNWVNDKVNLRRKILFKSAQIFDQKVKAN